MSADPKKRFIDHGENQFPRDAHALWELLEFAPVSLWLEDWSRVKQTLDGWRANGIADPVAHAAADISRVEILARAFRVIDVNATSVNLYGAPDKASLIADFERHAVETICGDMRDFFLDALSAFERGEKQVGIEAWERRYDGQRIRVHISCAIAPNDKKWERAVLAIMDVTEAWQTRAALDEGRDLLSQAAGLARLAHWIRDCASGAVIQCGEEIAAITGRSPEEWSSLVGGIGIEACIAPDDRARYRATVPVAFAASASYTIEYRLWQPDGTERWVRERGAPLGQATPAEPRYICTLQDITEQRHAEAARWNAETQLYGFLENAPFAMFVKSLDRRYAYANQRTARRLGRPLEQIIGHRLEEMFSPEAAEIYRRQDDQVIATEAPVIEESRVMGPTGEIWAKLIRFPILDEAGKVRAIGGMAIDITEIKQAEQELREQHDFLRLVIDSAAAYIMVFDGASRLVTCNKAYEDFSGLPLEALCRDDGWTRTVLPEDMAAVLDALAADDATKFPNSDLTRGIRADGDIRLVQWVNAALTNADGSIKNVVCIGTDITEQERAEAALRESEARLKAFVENAPFEITIKDRQGRYVMANEHVAAVTGIPVAQLIGRRLTELKSDAASHSYASHDRAVIETDMPISRQTSATTPKGTTWAQETKFPIRDARGELTGIGSVGIDITERKQVDEALRESEARWRAFKDNAPFPIFYKGIDGRYIDINREAEKFWKHSYDEVVGRSTAEIADPGEGVKFIEHDRQVLRTGQAIAREFHTPGHAEGEWVRDLKFPIHDEQGRIIALGGIGIDITAVKRAELALQESEANLRAVVEGIVEAIVTFDESGAILSASKAAERMFGHDEAALVGHELSMLLPGLAGERGGNGATGCLAAIEAGIGKSQELEAAARNGQRLTVAFSVNELPAIGGVRRFVGTILDLTQHKALEDRLRQAQKMETIGQFTGGIAHDFNNLLAVIIGNLDLLASRAPDERARKLMDRASGAAQRGADLTQRLLAFARQQRLKPVAIDLGELVKEMIPLAERTAGATVQIKPVIVAGLWRVHVDRVQLEAALLHLIGNALDAMPDGGELVIRVANHTAEAADDIDATRLVPGRYVEIAVVDSGAGMPPEIVKRAFDPFFTTKGVGQGTGLGLSMVHGFVRQSGGDAQIISTPGSGTVVCLYLPATDRPAEVTEKSDVAVAQASRPGQRVLVVDDEPEVLTLVKELLTALGYHVDGAGSGGEALERLRRPVTYDLLLTDVRMKGGISGPQLAAQARISRPELRVLFMSGYDDAAGTASGIPQGASLLHKPFRNDDLAQGVVRALSA